MSRPFDQSRLEPTLGRPLYELIRANHSDVKAACEAVGVSYVQVWDILLGRKRPRLDTLERIVGAFGGRVEYRIEKLSESR